VLLRSVVLTPLTCSPLTSQNSSDYIITIRVRLEDTLLYLSIGYNTLSRFDLIYNNGGMIDFGFLNLLALDFSYRLMTGFCPSKRYFADSLLKIWPRDTLANC
jgi:hypothetical protein